MIKGIKKEKAEIRWKTHRKKKKGGGGGEGPPLLFFPAVLPGGNLSTQVPKEGDPTTPNKTPETGGNATTNKTPGPFPLYTPNFSCRGDSKQQGRPVWVL